MLVKAKWNVKGSDGWHRTGEVFTTEEDFGNAVEVLDAPKQAPKPMQKQEPVKEPEKAAEPEKAEEVKAEETKPKTQNRRKNGR